MIKVTNNNVLENFDLTNWTPVGGGAVTDADTFTTSSTGGVKKESILTVGRKYRINLTGDTNLALTVRDDTGIIGTYASISSGSFNISIVITALSTGFYLRQGGVATTNITNFEVIDVTNKLKVDARDKLLGAKFTGFIIDGSATINGDGTADVVSASASTNILFKTSLTTGKRYRMTVECTSYTSGDLELHIGSATANSLVNTITGVGVFSGELVATNIYALLRTITTTGEFTGSLGDITIVEMDDKYSVGSLQKGLILDMPLKTPYTEASADIPRTFSIGSGTPTISGDEITFANEASYVTTGAAYWEIGKTYIIDWEIQDYAGSGIIKLYDASGASIDKTGNGRWLSTYTPDSGTAMLVYSYAGHTAKVIVHSVKLADGTIKDRTPYGNDGILSGATVTQDGLIPTVSGVAYIPQKLAYAEWEFDFNKVNDGTSEYITYINSTTGDYGSTSGNKYVFIAFSNESFYIVKKTDGSTAPTILLQTAASYFAINTDYRIKITRSTAGVTTLYIKGGAFGWDTWTTVSVAGGSGSNPFTDNTHTTSNYLIAQLSAVSTVGDKLSNLKINGKRVKLSNAIQVSGTWTPTFDATSFDGTDDLVTIGDTNQNIKGLSFWIYPTAANGYIMDLDGGSHFLWLDGVCLEADGFVDAKIRVNEVDSPDVTLNAWNHVTITTPTPIDVNALILGKVGANYLTGYLADLRLYTKDLSVAEKLLLYDKGRGN